MKSLFLIALLVLRGSGSDLESRITAYTKKMLSRLGIVPDSCYDIIEIINHLKYPNWQGVKKGGNHDLVMFLGFRTDLGNQGLSTLKHFAKHLRTLTLCPFVYHQASYFLPNLKGEKWKEWFWGSNKRFS